MKYPIKWLMEPPKDIEEYVTVKDHADDETYVNDLSTALRKGELLKLKTDSVPIRLVLQALKRSGCEKYWIAMRQAGMKFAHSPLQPDSTCNAEDIRNASGIFYFDRVPESN